MITSKKIIGERLRHHSDESSAQMRVEQKMHKLGGNEGFVTAAFSNLMILNRKTCNRKSVRHSCCIPEGNTEHSKRRLKLKL